MTGHDDWNDKRTQAVREFLACGLRRDLHRGMQVRIEAILDERNDAFDETGEEPHYRQHVAVFLQGVVRTQEPRLARPGVDWCELADERIEALAEDEPFTPYAPSRRMRAFQRIVEAVVTRLVGPA